MLKKLFKYDFLWLMKTMPYFYIAVLALGVCTFFTNKIYNSHLTVLAWLLIDKLVSGVFVLSCFAAGIVILIRSFMRFRNNLYKDEAYLTHTLPVSKSALFASKVLASFSACVITVGVIVAAFFITLAAVKDEDWYLELIQTQFVLLGIVFLEEILCFLLCMYGGIIIGNRSAKHRILVGVLMAGLLYFAVSQVVGIGLGITFFTDSSVRLLFQESPDLTAAKEALKLVSGVCLVTYTISCAALYFIDNKLLRKGVNVD